MRNTQRVFAILIATIAAGGIAEAQNTWGTETIAAGQGLTDVAYGGGRFVVTGEEGSLAHSTDAESWTVIPPGVGDDYVLQGVGYGCGEFLAVGADGVVLRSTDGTSWTEEVSGSTKFLSAVAYGAGRWVAVGGATQGSLASEIISSTTAGTWTPQSAGVASFFSDVAYGGGLFVAVGLGGTIITSPDGVSWSTATSGTTRYLSGVAYLDGQFVVVGQRGTVLVSSDGASWTVESIGVGFWMFDVGKAGSTYVAAGETGSIFTSADLSTWIQVASGTTFDLFGLTRGPLDMVAVGGAEGNPALVRSEVPAPPESTYLGWQFAKFSAAQITDAAVSAPFADPDCDDLVNAVEWSHDLDPFTADTLSLWSINATDNSGTIDASVDYIQNKARPLSVSVSVSADIITWAASGFVSSVLASDATTETLRFSDPAAVSTTIRRFYRLDFEVK